MKTDILEVEEEKKKLYFSHFLYRELLIPVIFTSWSCFQISSKLEVSNHTISGCLNTNFELSRPSLSNKGFTAKR